MKVCGKKDVHLPECDDCQELEERVEAVEECCDDAHGEIDTLTTEKADKSYVDLGLDNVDHKIDDSIDAVNERIDDIITASEPSITTLWEGVLTNNGDSAHLSDDVNNYDFLDVYYKTSEYEDQGYYGYIRVPAVEYVNYTTTIGGTKRPASGEDLSQYLTMLSFVDDTASIMNIREWSWNGDSASDAVDDNQPLSGIIIYRIDGVKETGGNLEIADARIGVDGTVYPSLGDAIRGQIQDTRDMIPQLVKTVNGNPIVIDDAFGEVKNLDVELTPIQDLNGYDKPWAGGAGNNKWDEEWVVAHEDISTTTGEIVSVTSQYQYFRSKNYIPVQGGVPYYNVNGMITGNYRFFYYDSNYSFISWESRPVNAENTPPANASYMLFRFVASSMDLEYQNNIAINYPSTVTTYSPYSNICPITGHDSVTVTDTGKNIFDVSTNYIEQGTITSSNGQDTLDSRRVRTHGYTPVLEETAYAISVSGTVTSFYAHYYDKTHTYIGSTGAWKQSGTAITTPSGAKYMRLVLSVGGTATAVTPSDVSSIQVELGNTATTYESYHGQSKTVTLPHTVYGAGVGVTSGESKETWANIPSYNGETITEPWLSSMDEYVQGATPTTGAQVTYKLATPADLSTTPTDITLYSGDNVISSDGDMELTYVQDMAAVIRKIESQL